MEDRFLKTSSGFETSHEQFLKLTQVLSSSNTMHMRHSSLENLITVEGRELMRRLFEEHLKLRGHDDIGQSVKGSDGRVRTHKRIQKRKLISVFGEVEIERMGYGARGTTSIFPKDAFLNLPTESYSHGIRRLIAKEYPVTITG